MILVLKILDKNSSFSPLSVCLFLIANSWLYIHLVHFPFVCLSVYPSLSVCLSLSPSFLIDILLLSLRLVFFILFLEFLDNRRCVNLFSQALFLKSCLTASFFFYLHAKISQHCSLHLSWICLLLKFVEAGEKELIFFYFHRGITS